ncbi:thiamine pyrophosphokinase [Microsporum audouinii]
MKSIGLEDTELPNVIVGDLDSIHLDVLRHYESLGVKVVKNPDQYSTDFMKCLSYLAGNCKDILNTVKQQGRGDSGSCFKSEAGDLDVVIFGGLGGRVDQGFAQIHHLFCATPSASEQIIRPNGETYLVSEESISFFLHQGKNTIFTPGGSSFKKEKGIRAETKGPNNICSQLCFSENIGIIPIGGPSLISTQGLEWDVRNWKTEFGGRLSTSNHIRAESVEVETSIPVLFTVELAPYLKVNASSGLL